MKLINIFKKNCFLLSVLIFFSACTVSNSGIKEIDSISQVKNIFDTAAKDDLFVFDIDDVILESKDPDDQTRFSKDPEIKKINDSFMNFIKNKNYSEEKKNEFFSKLILKMSFEPVEKSLIDYILELQKRKIKVVALSHFYTGKYGLIENSEERRYKECLTIGLDFGFSFEQQIIVLDELQKTDFYTKNKSEKGKNLNPAVFYKGIIGTNSYPKGIVLKAFLEKINLKPAQIYFFDDKLKNLESVIQEMKKMGIKCYAFLYKAATVNRSTNDLDIEVAKLKAELMKQREDFVSYFEAKDILEYQRNGHKKELQRDNKIIG